MIWKGLTEARGRGTKRRDWGGGGGETKDCVFFFGGGGGGCCVIVAPFQMTSLWLF